MRTIAYRAEIDGLRALAVTPVVLFHAGIPGFTGGFVGVDIFFVISGFLITSIIAKELARGEFSFGAFYERRARRLLPALFIMMICCAPFAWRWMPPDELAAFGRSVIATCFFVSNFLFWRESGYFDPITEMKPLMHTWSLAVEEQYYIFLPIILVLIWRFGRPVITVAILAGVVASLALAQWGVARSPGAAFYLAPTRFWEILAGALCAWLLPPQGVRNNALSVAGLTMMLAAIVCFDSQTPTPSIWTALPVAGAALVLGFGTADTLVGRLLRFRPFVAIGLISYSVYLWHQPILAFARLRAIGELPLWASAMLIPPIFLIGWASWKYVENPFRSRRLIGARGTVFAASMGGMALASIAGGALALTNGAPWRTTPGGDSFSDFAFLSEIPNPNHGLSPKCDSFTFSPSETCRSGSSPDTLLWGDSYAMHLADALRNSRTPVTFQQATYSQCGPLPGLAIQGIAATWRSCIAFNDAVLKWLLAQPSIKTVVVSSQFRQMETPIYRRDGSRIVDQAERDAAVSDSLIALSRTLADHGKKLVIISPPPESGLDVGRCEARRLIFGLPASTCAIDYQDYARFSDRVISALKIAAREAPVIWLSQFTCTGSHCRTHEGAIPLYRDAGHLSAKGSAALGARVDLARLILTAQVNHTTALRSP